MHLTNTHLSKKTFKEAGEEGQWEGMTEEQLREYQMWTLEQLSAYLLKAVYCFSPYFIEVYFVRGKLLIQIGLIITLGQCLRELLCIWLG